MRLILRESVGLLAAERIQRFDDAIERWKKRSTLSEPQWLQLEGHADLGQRDAIDPATQILELTVCDPAMGSGHFLVALGDDLADRVLEAASHASELVNRQAWAAHLVGRGRPWESPVIARIAHIRPQVADLTDVDIAKARATTRCRAVAMSICTACLSSERKAWCGPMGWWRCFGPVKIADFIREQVLRLSYTAHDPVPLARDLGHVDRRRRLAALDGLFMHLYGLDDDDAGHVLDSFPIDFSTLLVSIAVITRSASQITRSKTGLPSRSNTLCLTSRPCAAGSTHCGLRNPWASQSAGTARSAMRAAACAVRR